AYPFTLGEQQVEVLYEGPTGDRHRKVPQFQQLAALARRIDLEGKRLLGTRSRLVQGLFCSLCPGLLFRSSGLRLSPQPFEFRAQDVLPILLGPFRERQSFGFPLQIELISAVVTVYLPVGDFEGPRGDAV